MDNENMHFLYTCELFRRYGVSNNELQICIYRKALNYKPILFCKENHTLKYDVSLNTCHNYCYTFSSDIQLR